MSDEARDPRVGVAIPAAGGGSRLGGTDKAFLELGGAPVLLHALRPFLEHPSVTSLSVALAPRLAFPPPAWIEALDSRLRVVAGAETRTRSVLAALEALDPDIEVVVVHDAARPLVTREIIDRCIQGAVDGGGAVAGWPVVDTLKEVDSRSRVLATPDRGRLWKAQTPQAFPYRALVEAYHRGIEAGFPATDDAQIFSEFGGTVRMVEGSPWNLKITFPEDLAVADLLLARQRGAFPER